MARTNRHPIIVRWLLTLLVLALWLPHPLHAISTPPASPPSCDPSDDSDCPEEGSCPINSGPGGSSLSYTEGNLKDSVPVFGGARSGCLSSGLHLTYNSFNADGSNFRTDTVLGFGWTHSYNLFFTEYRFDAFLHRGNGVTAKFDRKPNGTYTALEGYFETLEKIDANTFVMTDKGGTEYRFEKLDPAPFLMPGPPYYITRITERNGKITTFTYNATSRLEKITDHYSREVLFTYNTDQKIETITDPLGRITRLGYGPNSYDLEEITDPENQVIDYTYNALHQLIAKNDKDGRQFTYAYNSSGKPVAITDGAGQTLFTLSNPDNWQTDFLALIRETRRIYIPSTTTKLDGRGNPWDYEYDENGYLTKIIAPDGTETRYTYDPATLKVASETDANGNTTQYEYDANGNRTKRTDALGHVTTYTFEPVFNNMTSMTDPKGRTTTFEYDDKGNRIKETDPLGNTREWTYDSDGYVLTETDKNGNLTTHEYDAFGNRIRTTDALGNVTTMTYDAVGNMLSRTDANEHTTTFEYDGLNRLVKETDPTGKATTTAYDGAGNRIQVTDRNGNSTRFEYDERQRLVKTTDALEQVTTQTYDDNDNRISVTDKNGNTTTFEYDEQDRLIQTTDALGNTTTRTYDGVGNLLSETDANGHTATHEYDALNRRITTTDAVGCITRSEYDGVGLTGCPECTGPTLGSGLVTKQTDGNGKVTYFKYDGLDRLIIEIRKEGDTADVIDPSDAVTTTTYDPNGNRLAVTEPNGNTSTFVYDALNRVVQETNAAGDTTLTAYDGVHNVITVTAPNGNLTTNTYDDLDRVIQVQDSVGLVATYTYDAEGNRLSERDGNGNGTDSTYDEIYRLIKVTDALGEMTLQAYDPVGNLIETTDREGKGTTHDYDAINRRIQTTDALGNVTLSEYDGVGNLVKLTDANGNPTEYEYDDVNRLITETYADSGVRTFTYDCVGNRLSRTDQEGQTIAYAYNDLYFLLQRDYPVSADDNFSYDLSGRMETAERDGWLVTFDYDGANRVIETTQDGQIVTYAYDIPGRTRTITYPGGRIITESMDPRDRLSRVDRGAGPVFPITPIALYDYDLGNRVLTRQYENGVVGDYAYNANNWVTGLEHAVGATLIAGFGHDYDNEGNKRYEEKPHDTENSEAYAYDDIYRLIDYKVGEVVGSIVPVPSTQTAYDLDPLGNWDSKDTDGVTEDRTHNVVNELTAIDGVPLDYGDNGNLIEDERYEYTYDEENRLVTVKRKVDAQIVGQYQYDALSRRVVKLANPSGTVTETRYFYDDARVIEEQDFAAVSEATYVYGNYIDEVLTMDRGEQVYYYHQNALWSVAAITDALANVVERYSYDAYGCVTVTDSVGATVPSNAWGTPRSAIANPYMFTGRRLDEETGIYYYRARYYDCAKGRFMQRDPSGYLDSMNLYEYVKSNPTAVGDPSGELGLFPPGWLGRVIWPGRRWLGRVIFPAFDLNICTIKLIKCRKAARTLLRVELFVCHRESRKVPCRHDLEKCKNCHDLEKCKKDVEQAWYTNYNICQKAFRDCVIKIGVAELVDSILESLAPDPPYHPPGVPSNNWPGSFD